MSTLSNFHSRFPTFDQLCKQVSTNYHPALTNMKQQILIIIIIIHNHRSMIEPQNHAHHHAEYPHEQWPALSPRDFFIHTLCYVSFDISLSEHDRSSKFYTVMITVIFVIITSICNSKVDLKVDQSWPKILKLDQVSSRVEAKLRQLWIVNKS